MKTTTAATALITLALATAASFATVPGPQPTPSARLSIDVDVKPAGEAGRFMVSSTITDLESEAVVARPRLLVAANQPATIETGAEGKWLLHISVAADATGRTAAYNATFTREGKIVSKQRLTINLNG